MRTTITLDPDVEEQVRRVMRERGLTFEEAVNRAIRAGLTPRGSAEAVRIPTYGMGFDEAIAHGEALRAAGASEDEELARKLASRE